MKITKTKSRLSLYKSAMLHKIYLKIEWIIKLIKKQEQGKKNRTWEVDVE